MLDRRAFLGTSTLAMPFIAGFAAAEQGQLASLVIDPANAKLTHESYGDQRIYFDGPTGQLRTLTVGSLALKAGMVPHPPHQHPEEEIILVTDGAGEITVEGKTYAVRGTGIDDVLQWTTNARYHCRTARPHLLFLQMESLSVLPVAVFACYNLLTIRRIKRSRHV